MLLFPYALKVTTTRGITQSSLQPTSTCFQYYHQKIRILALTGGHQRIHTEAVFPVKVCAPLDQCVHHISMPSSDGEVKWSMRVVRATTDHINLRFCLQQDYDDLIVSSQCCEVQRVHS